MIPTFGRELVATALQAEPRGTGDAAKAGIETVAAERVLVLYGDTPLLRAEELARVSAALSEGTELCLMACRIDEPSGYGRVLRDAQGRDWFMELNGRSWGSMALARRAGLEYPAWTAQQLVDDRFVPPEPIAPALAIRCRHLGRELNHLLLVLRGPKTATPHWPSRWRTALDLLRFGSRDYWYNWQRGEWGVFWHDAWDTVWGALRGKRA